MIGDMSGEHALELTSGPREKLKYISKETMLEFIKNGHHLMSGLESHSIWMDSLQFIWRPSKRRGWISNPDQINTFYIIDSRYPYEFQGGHIRGATNLPSSVSTPLLFKYCNFYNLGQRQSDRKQFIIEIFGESGRV